MRRYTTPTLPLIVQGIDLTGADVWVTLAQKAHIITVDDANMELDEDGNTVISVDLTQFQTAEFREGTMKVQVNWIDELGRRNASNEALITVDGNLLDRVLS